ncbi:hypothetical protein SOVF_027120 [Spinacia oleracea]|nr:hypothetical protein SOVF_027120 [Spinacia oleracea]
MLERQLHPATYVRFYMGITLVRQGKLVHVNPKANRDVLWKFLCCRGQCGIKELLVVLE